MLWRPRFSVTRETTLALAMGLPLFLPFHEYLEQFVLAPGYSSMGTYILK